MTHKLLQAAVPNPRRFATGIAPPPEGEQGSVVPALIAAFCGIALLALASLWLDRAEGEYLVIASPFEDPRAVLLAVARAEGSVTGAGAFQNLLRVQAATADFAGRLQAQTGAVVLPVPRVLSCLPESSLKG